MDKILKESYIYKFISLIKEMKRIKEINPEALSEPSYSPYDFFKIFV